MADLKIAGKIIEVGPIESGIGKASGKEWTKQQFVIETVNDSFPRNVAFSLFNDRIQQNQSAIGDVITISFDVESRKFKDKWYTDIRVWRVEQGDTTQQSMQQAANQNFQGNPVSNNTFSQPAQPTYPPTPQNDPFNDNAGKTDDLPF